MKISQIAVYQVTLPLEHPYRLSGGRLYFDKLDSTIIAIKRLFVKNYEVLVAIANRLSIKR